MAGSKIAVVSAPGIGDGLIFHIVSHNLAQMGCDVTTFNDHLEGFGKWLNEYRFSKQPCLDKIEEIFAPFDAIVLQHDNTEKSKKIRLLNKKIFGFYGSHLVSKHGALRDLDYVADPRKCMVENVVEAMYRWFKVDSKENGLKPPQGLIHRKYRKRIAIHPSSGVIEKNWNEEKFIKVAETLQKEGFDPVFIIHQGKPLVPTLEELASFLFESGAFLGNDSGPGHLASYLEIPSLIIGKEESQMRLWRPGWYPSVIATPPSWTSRFRWSRKNWKSLVSTKSIIKKLKHNVLIN